MDYHSVILVFILGAITVVSAQVDLESFRRCIVEQGLSPDLTVHHSTGNSTLYAELDYRWNIRPVLAYFVPTVTSDVQVAVRCARANNIRVIPKSGGHSAELLSYGNAGSIVIAFQNMKKIQINASEKIALIAMYVRHKHTTVIETSANLAKESTVTKLFEADQPAKSAVIITGNELDAQSVVGGPGRNEGVFGEIGNGRGQTRGEAIGLAGNGGNGCASFGGNGKNDDPGTGTIEYFTCTADSETIMTEIVINFTE